MGRSTVAAPVRNHTGETITAIGMTVDSASVRARMAPLWAAATASADAVSAWPGFNPEFTADGRYWWMSGDGREHLSPARPVRAKRSGRSDGVDSIGGLDDSSPD